MPGHFYYPNASAKQFLFEIIVNQKNHFIIVLKKNNLKKITWKILFNFVIAKIFVHYTISIMLKWNTRVKNTYRGRVSWCFFKNFWFWSYYTCCKNYKWIKYFLGLPIALKINPLVFINVWVCKKTITLSILLKYFLTSFFYNFQPISFQFIDARQSASNCINTRSN